MIDEQVRKIIDRTFSEVDILVKEVQQKRKYRNKEYKCDNAGKAQKAKSIKGYSNG